MGKHTKQKQGDDGVIIDPSHTTSVAHEAHMEKRIKAIKSAPDLSKLIPVNIPELRCTIFMKPGECAADKIAAYKERLRFAVNTAQKKNGKFLTVEE